MKLTFLLALILVAAIMVEDTEAYSRRYRLAYRRISNNACRKVCSKVCPRAAPIGSTECLFVCKKLCNRNNQIPDYQNDDPNYEVVAMSKDFSHYDLDKDKMISMEEFSRAQLVPLDDVQAPYHFADVDGDGFLDKDEFETAPFVFTEAVAQEMNEIARSVYGNDAVDPVLNGENSQSSFPGPSDTAQAAGPPPAYEI